MLRNRPLLRTVLAATLLAGGVAAFAVTSVDRATARAHGPVGGDQEIAGPGGHDALEGVMEGLKDHLRQLASTVANPDANAESFAHLSAMQALTLEAKPLEPSNLASLPEAQRDAHRTDFRRDMARLLRELADMEILILDGKNAEAKEHIKSQLLELRDSAHDKFQEH